MEEAVTVSAPAPSAAPERGGIQPRGFLLGLSEEWVVTHASANAGEFVGGAARDLIGRPASDHLSIDAIHSLRNRLALMREPDAAERMFRCALLGDERRFDLAIHRAGSAIVLEAQPSCGKDYGDVTGTVLGMMSRLAGVDNLATLLDLGARQIRALTGFDRIAIVRFNDDDDSGEVVTECARANAGSTIGERTSLTPDALRRYRHRPLHVIADLAAPAVGLLSEPASDPLDLSRSMLGAGSPERLAALRERDASAAMLLSLIVGGRLWGVIDCQHHFARSPAFERRSMAELFVHMFALRVEICQLKTGREA